ncbi:MAG: CRISPR system precrRNA processing endoribonuclease RAMP protein Cas6 [Acidobacteriota bacterium]
MLHSLVVLLLPARPAVLPATLGRHAHAALLGIVKAADPELAAEMHDTESEKPFTVSPLQGPLESDGTGRVRMQVGGEYWLRFTFLADALYETVSRFFLETASAVLPLEEVTFTVMRVTSTSSQDTKWSGFATFEKLWEEAKPVDGLAMRFYSPTCFRVTESRGRSRNVAEPSLWHCVQSWVSRWNRFAPPALSFERDRLLEFVQQTAQLRRANIETRSLDFGAYRKTGFVGRVEWVIGPARGTSFAEVDAGEMCRQLDALASFAFYCGTGYKTTMGMGQTRRVGTARRGER